MFERLRALVLQAVRVPPEPEPPFGNPAMIRVFRASRRLYLLRLVGWGIGQAAALIGIIFWLTIMVAAKHEARKSHSAAAGNPTPTVVDKRGRIQGPSQAAQDVAAKIPESLFGWLWLAEGLGLVFYIGQLGITYMGVRLDYELRWYMVTDRSLRIRSGLWTVQEITMSFANLQKVMVSQGPLQRLLGIADVRVESAGGGGGVQAHQHGQVENLHTGVFHGVENASEIRDLILERLRQFRETGLGDPDEERHSPPAVISGSPHSDVLSAARELLNETRALRSVLAPK